MNKYKEEEILSIERERGSEGREGKRRSGESNRVE